MDLAAQANLVEALDQETLITPQVNLFSRFAFQSVQGAAARVKAAKPDSRVNWPMPELPCSNSSSSSSPKGQRQAPGSSESPSRKRVKVYHHLKELDDHLCIGLDILFCGINPGERSAQMGHHYANPTNHFWSCLHESGLTARRLVPSEDHLLPGEFSLGLTNLVSRPTVQEKELSNAEQTSGVSLLLEKVARYQPLMLCFVGLGIADVVKSEVGYPSKTRGKAKATIGLQPYKVVHSDTKKTLFFAVSSTSGRVVQYQKNDKVNQFKQLHETLREMKSGHGALDTSTLTSIPAPQPRTPSTSQNGDQKEATIPQEGLLSPFFSGSLSVDTVVCLER